MYITFLGSTMRNNTGLPPQVVIVSHMQLSDIPTSDNYISDIQCAQKSRTFTETTNVIIFNLNNLPCRSWIINNVKDRYNSEGCNNIVWGSTHQSMIIPFHMKQLEFRHVLRRHKCHMQWLRQVYQFSRLALSFFVSSCS